jgi:hypothetical protein
MNLSLRAIFTVEAIFSYVILRQDFAEELRAIRPTRRRLQTHAPNCSGHIDQRSSCGEVHPIGVVILTSCRDEI